MRILTPLLKLATAACALYASLCRISPAAGAESPDCAAAGIDWVRVSIDVQQDSPFVHKLLEHIRAELAPHRIEACAIATNSFRPPLAHLRIARATANQVLIEVQVEDAVTDKTVTRQLDLTGLPPDAHALTIALGAAELLRASWAEVNLKQSTTAPRPVPAGVRHTLDEARKTGPATASLGFHLAGEEFTRGLRQGGADARFTIHALNPWQWTLCAGVRQALSVRASDGVVRASSWLAGVGSALRLTPLDTRASLVVTSLLEWAHLQALAEPKPGATATSGSGAALLAGLGALASLSVTSSAQLELEVDAGGVIKGVRVVDGSREVLAMNGAWAGTSAGLNVRFW